MSRSIVMNGPLLDEYNGLPGILRLYVDGTVVEPLESSPEIECVRKDHHPEWASDNYWATERTREIKREERCSWSNAIDAACEEFDEVDPMIVVKAFRKEGKAIRYRRR